MGDRFKRQTHFCELIFNPSRHHFQQWRKPFLKILLILKELHIGYLKKKQEFVICGKLAFLQCYFRYHNQSSIRPSTDLFVVWKSQLCQVVFSYCLYRYDFKKMSIWLSQVGLIQRGLMIKSYIHRKEIRSLRGYWTWVVLFIS